MSCVNRRTELTSSTSKDSPLFRASLLNFSKPFTAAISISTSSRLWSFEHLTSVRSNREASKVLPVSPNLNAHGVKPGNLTSLLSLTSRSPASWMPIHRGWQHCRAYPQKRPWLWTLHFWMLAQLDNMDCPEIHQWWCVQGAQSCGLGESHMLWSAHHSIFRGPLCTSMTRLPNRNGSSLLQGVRQHSCTSILPLMHKSILHLNTIAHVWAFLVNATHQLWNTPHRSV